MAAEEEGGSAPLLRVDIEYVTLPPPEGIAFTADMAARLVGQSLTMHRPLGDRPGGVVETAELLTDGWLRLGVRRLP